MRRPRPAENSSLSRSDVLTMKTEKQAWLRCEVQAGMFSDEVVVSVVTTDGTARSFFVPKEAVANGDKVRVQMTTRSGVLWVTLPTAHPYNAMPVRKADLIGEEVVPV